MIPVESVHTAVLTVPVSGDPADKISVFPAVKEDGSNVLVFSATSEDSPSAARQKIRDFLDAAKMAASSP